MRWLLLWLFVVSAAADAAAPHCSALPTAAERIVCYDGLYPPEHPEPPRATEPVPSETPVASVPAEPKLPAKTSASSTPIPAMSPADANSRDGDTDETPWHRGLFDKPEPVNLTSTIKALRRKETQNPIYLLDNDQLWLQDSTRALPFRVGDAVTITNGTFGGYFMTSESGTKVRVRRIK